MSINCTAFIERDLCFSRIDPATATLGNQSQRAKLSLAFSLDGNENFFALRCWFRCDGEAVVIRKEYNRGVCCFHSLQTSCKDKFRMPSAVVFLNIEDAFGDTMVVHSTDSCLNVHLISSALSSLTRNAALAISAHVPLSNIHPKLSRLFCSLRCLV